MIIINIINLYSKNKINHIQSCNFNLISRKKHCKVVLFILKYKLYKFIYITKR